MNAKFPLKIHRLEEGPRCRFKAATAMERVLEAPRQVERALRLVDLDYDVTITAARHAMGLAKQNGRADAQAYWLAAWYVQEFLNRLSSAGFYLVKKNGTLARDLGISESSTEKLLSFQRRFPDISALDLQVPWNHYRANKVRQLGLKI